MTSRRKPDEPSRSQYMLDLAKEFDKESDRGSILLAAAYLDYLLADLLASIMIGTKDDLDALLRMPTSPLGTFSSRIRLTYSLGLISADESKDLHNIREIRNKFAHRLFGLSFATDSIKDRCKNLIGAKIDGQPASSREQFKKASIRLMVNIILKINKKTARKKSARKTH
jgi:DNA-binding MltR family transcriptional regulator